MPKTLQANDLSKDYPTRRGSLSVLRGVSLTLDEGRAAVIMGPSGSGKSTLLNILGTLEPPTAGRVLIDEVDPFELAEPQLAAFRNRRIGFIFQEHHLLPHCSVLENVLLPTLVRRGKKHSALGAQFREGPGDQGTGGPGGAHSTQHSALSTQHSAEDCQTRARRLLDRVGLSGRLDHRPAELSGGERQRVAVARSLINRPLVLLADEPTGNLDQATAATVAELILEMHREERTILLVVTHNPIFAEKFERRYELTDGTLVTSHAGPGRTRRG